MWEVRLANHRVVAAFVQAGDAMRFLIHLSPQIDGNLLITYKYKKPTAWLSQADAL